MSSDEQVRAGEEIVMEIGADDWKFLLAVFLVLVAVFGAVLV